MENISHFEELDESTSLFGNDLQKDRQYFLEEVRKHEPNADHALVAKAFDFCCEKHKGIYRKSGLPYYTHPLNVTIILLHEFPIHDTISIVCALLHDTIEDCKDVSKATITEEFNQEVGDIVEALSKIKHENITKDVIGTKEQYKALTYRKLFLSLVRDIRVILIKIADRMHNIRTLKYMVEHKQSEIANETLNFYVPFAHRLGLMKIKMELENRSFYYLDKDKYEAIRSELNAKRWSFIDYINVFSTTITNSLNSNDFHHIISVVHKHEYEVYKMLEDGKNLKDIDNFYSLVIILETKDANECYRAYGALANAFKTVQFLDEIAHPTVDWYRSLRLDVMGPDGKRVEILIRTEEMERFAEEGFLSKENNEQKGFNALQYEDEDVQEWGEWMEDIIEIKGEEAAQTIWNSIKVNIFDSSLSVYTKTGEEIQLPQDSSMLDFAFAVNGYDAIHTIAGKINGKTVNIKSKLTQGDQIEILTSKNVTPENDWINNVIHYKAVVKLYNYFQSILPTEQQFAERPNNSKEVKLIIKGEDRSKMLTDITEVIGKKDIKRIYLDTLGVNFEGILTIQIEDDSELNLLYLKLFDVPGITAVIVEEVILD